jgi:hypothetical protein
MLGPIMDGDNDMDLLRRGIKIITPQRLWAFYILTFVILLGPEFVIHNSKWIYFAQMVVSLLLLLIHLGWPIAIWTIFGQKLSKARVKFIPILLFAGVAIVLFIYNIWALYWTDLGNLGIQDEKDDPSFLFIFSGPFVIAFCYWVATRSICEAESRLSINSSGKFLTFLEFFYLPIGIFPLEKRIKSLLGAVSGKQPGDSI